MNTTLIKKMLSVALVAGTLLGAQPVQASLPCNDIIDFDGNRQPISDCDNPFGQTNPIQSLTLHINGELVEESATVGVPDLNSVEFSFGGLSDFVESIILYKHDGDDYRAVGTFFEPALDGEGVYTLVVSEGEPPILSQYSPWEKMVGWLLPTAHAQTSPPPSGPPPDLSLKQTLTFTVFEEKEIEEIDPLLLEYAPILRMHEDEDYYPMRMEDFVTGSALWDQGGLDDQLFSTASLTVEKFVEVINSDDTDDYYLAYSDPDKKKSLDLAAAKEKYGTPDPDDVTIYVHRMNDSDGDKEYIVLQYWQFYAMNNWAEQGGFNNHEGDFESVFIFLDADTERPKYVAYSAHHNRGESDIIEAIYYDSVRRSWGSGEVTRNENERIISYVSLGSHANYSNNGNEGSHLTGINRQVDETSEDGTDIFEGIIFSSFNETLLDFEGRWGADTVDFVNGESGPKGPQFLNVGGTTRFLNPVEWAGIDDISEVTILEPVTTVPFIDSGVSFEFTEPIPAGTEFTITPYQEPITFGVPPADTTLLPTYWDLESSLPNDTFEVDVSLNYDPAVVEALEGDEEDLVVFFFNPDSTEWEPQTSSLVDTVENTVTFTNTTFSRYALGLLPEVPEEPKTLTELFAELKAEVQEADLSRVKEKRLLRTIKLAEKFAAKDRPVFKRIAKRTLQRAERVVERYARRGVLDKETAEEIVDFLDEIRTLIGT